MKNRVVVGLLICVLCSSLTIPAFATASTEDNIFSKILTQGDSEEESITESDIEESANSDKPLSDKQLSSIAMLNHLTVLTQEINASSNSRVYLDNVYSDIVNNTNPNAVDEDSLYEIKKLLNTIYGYQSIEVKREHLQYIYEQNQAQAMRHAIPNPMTILNIVESRNPVKSLISIVYMAVDAKNSYDNYMSEVESKYLEDSWQLDAEAAQNLHDSRSGAFEYMVSMCQTYDIDKDMALNEKSVETFVNWENNTNVTRKIEFLESNEATYKSYGKYWIVLAESYYEQEDYQKCLDSIETYQSMNIDTFRKDHDLAKILTKGIVAARECKTDKQYIEYANQALDIIIKNIEPEDWSLRYFVAATYMELSAITNDESYLQTAYELAESNVNYLIDEQIAQNKDYMAPSMSLREIKKQDSYKNATKEEQKEIRDYYEFVQEERETALPPIYQPLVLNCDLLFGLAEQLHISDAEKEKINNLLYTSDEPLFFIDSLNETYRFGESDIEAQPDIEFDKNRIEIPVTQLAYGSSINVTVSESGEDSTYDDWTIDMIDREDESDITSFTAEYRSKAIKDHDFSENSIVKIEILPPEDTNLPTKEYTFKAVQTKKLFVLKDLQFEMVK